MTQHITVHASSANKITKIIGISDTTRHNVARYRNRWVVTMLAKQSIFSVICVLRNTSLKIAQTDLLLMESQSV